MGSVLVSAMTLPTPALSRNYVENPDIINFYSSYACLPHFNLMFLPELFIFPEAFRNKDSTDTFVRFSYSFILLRPSCLLPSLSLSIVSIHFRCSYMHVLQACSKHRYSYCYTNVHFLTGTFVLSGICKYTEMRKNSFLMCLVYAQNGIQNPLDTVYTLK